IDTILKVIDAKKAGEVKRIIVAGCLPQRYRRELQKDLKEIDEFRGVVSTFKDDYTSRLTPAHYKYIKISEGCRNRCTYCIIPHLKGPYKARVIDLIIKEAEQSPAKEIILVGQDTSAYKRLAELLERVDKISKDRWIRLLYAHPANLGKDVIKVIRDSKNICKYIDLPIEHINDRILRQMGRKTAKKDIVSLIEYIRKEIPGVALRTSFIVGFPGETEKEFQELLSFIKEIKFERLGLFRYSREEGTPAYKLKKQVSEKEKERRFSEGMLLQQAISREINERFKGRTLKVLVDEKGIARTEYDAPEVDGVVHVSGKDLKVGEFYNVCITDTYEYDLVGRPTRSTYEVG
ncbi:MAG: MiaB/RimO family radical SAM methylthiotransferase, partial [Candidatus Omnitrophica bacterium]|nr:MiaB/RimO family radical SAM methylthiotransferase [Candidatus Omnitrophota bacterium]